MSERDRARAASVDVLIPTSSRPDALAVTLTALGAQQFRDFNIVVSDQSPEGAPAAGTGVVKAVLRILRLHGHAVEVRRHVPRRGLAEQRQFLLDASRAPYVLFLDDDMILEPDMVGRMHRAIREAGCGFVGCASIGLSYLNDVRPDEEHIEFWDGPVVPETVRPDTPQWERHRLHNAANIYHLQRRLGLTALNQRKYRVAWVGGCVMYDAEKLRDAGGFGFWRELPENVAGEDVLAQLRVMSRYGGCGLLPSGVYHQELPTTVPDRSVLAPHVLPLERGGATDPSG